MFLYILLIVIITIKLVHYIYNKKYKESFNADINTDWDKTNEYQLSEENKYINQYKSMFGEDNMTNGYITQYKDTKSCVNSNNFKCLIPNLLK